MTTMPPFLHIVFPAFCTVVILSDRPVEYTPNLDVWKCASKSDIVFCVRIFLRAYNVTACVNLNGTVEETPAAQVLGIADNLQVFETEEEVTVQILSATPIYRYALVTGLVKKPGCRHMGHGIVYLNGKCGVHR